MIFHRAVLIMLVLITPAAAADHVPTLDVNPTCDATASGGITGAKSDRQTCQRKENEARDQLTQNWNKYDRAARDRCERSTAGGGVPSYVELLTCLEMAQAARELPEDGLGGTTTGQGGR
jgi:hypothetical protein